MDASQFLQKAEEALLADQPEIALEHLANYHQEDVLQGSSTARDPTKDHMLRITALSQVLTVNDPQGWWDLMSLNPSCVDIDDIQRGYRRLSRLIHPDKMVGQHKQLSYVAQKGFAKLQEGMKLLEDDVRIHGYGDSRKDDPRRHMEGEYGGSEDIGFEWWTEWEPSWRQSNRNELEFGARGTSMDCRFQKLFQAQKLFQEDAVQTKDNAQDTLMLESMDIPALRHEVEKRQEEMLSPSRTDDEGDGGSGAGAISLAELRQRLLRARRVLTRKLNDGGVEIGYNDLSSIGSGGFMPPSL